MHRAGGAIALACALAAPATARDLLILEAGGLRDSGHDVGQLVDDFLSQEGAFSSLSLQPSYSATLDYLGIADAIRVDAAAFGTQVVLSIPSTGFSRTFAGTSPDDIEDQVESFFEGDGADELAEFLEETHERTALALLDGNPRSTTALFARGAFDRFGLGAPRTRAGYGQATVADWGHLDLGVEVGGGAVDVDDFSPLTVVDGAITLGGDFEPGLGVYLSLLGQYRNYDGADIYDVGLELGIPIALLRPGAGSSLRWTLTPVLQAGGGGSEDLLAGGFMIGGGGVSSFGLNFGPFELTVANQLLYYGGVPLGEIGDVQFETELDRLLTRNGAKLALYPLFVPALFVEAGAAYTNFLSGDAAVDGYVSPFAGIGLSLFELVRVRVGWESDFGDDYAAHTGRLDVGFAL